MQVNLVRNDADETPWGFRLQGGFEKNRPITIYRITSNSIAEKQNLQVGDILESLNGLSLREMTLETAQERIKEADNQLLLVITRNAESPGTAVPPDGLLQIVTQNSEKIVDESAPKGTHENGSNNHETERDLLSPLLSPLLNKYNRQHSNPVYSTGGADVLTQDVLDTPSEYGTFRRTPSSRSQGIFQRSDKYLSPNFDASQANAGTSRTSRAGSLQPSECSFAANRKTPVRSPALERIRRQSELQMVLSEEAQRTRSHSDSLEIEVPAEAEPLDGAQQAQARSYSYLSPTVSNSPLVLSPTTFQQSGSGRQSSSSPSSTSSSLMYQNPTPYRPMVNGYQPKLIQAGIFSHIRTERALFDGARLFDKRDTTAASTEFRRSQLYATAGQHPNEPLIAFDSEAKVHDKVMRNQNHANNNQLQNIEANFANIQDGTDKTAKYKGIEDNYTPSGSVGAFSQQSALCTGAQTEPKAPQTLHSIMKVPGADISGNWSNTLGTQSYPKGYGRRSRKGKKRVAINPHPHVQILCDDFGSPNESEDSTDQSLNNYYKC